MAGEALHPHRFERWPGHGPGWTEFAESQHLLSGERFGLMRSKGSGVKVASSRAGGFNPDPHQPSLRGRPRRRSSSADHGVVQAHQRFTVFGQTLAGDPTTATDLADWLRVGAKPVAEYRCSASAYRLIGTLCAANPEARSYRNPGQGGQDLAVAALAIYEHLTAG